MPKGYKSRPAPPPPLELHYRLDRGVYRVWRNDWRGDNFNVVTAEQLAEIERVCKLFSIPFRNLEGDDDYLPEYITAI